MGHHATIGRSLRPAPRVTVTDRRMNTRQPSMPVTVEEFEPITPGIAATMAPNYSRGSFPTKGQMSTGQTLLGIHLSNGTEFRKLSATREELKVAGGKLVLRKVTRKDRSAWVGEFYAHGETHGLVLAMIPCIKGEPPVKAECRDMLIRQAVLSAHSIY